MGRHEHRVGWRVLFFYGVVSLIVLVVGGVVLFTFFERQTLRQSVVPEPLPKITVVTSRPESKFVAGWVELLGRADFAPTLVPIERFDSLQGVIVLVELPQISSELAALLEKYVSEGGGVVVLGSPPKQETPLLNLVVTDQGISDSKIRMSEAVSPLLARMNPGYELGSKPVSVSFLDETPQMVVDGRWMDSSRAAAVHFLRQRGRVMWIGFDPEALYNPNDKQLTLFLRTAMRWVAGQPVSDGAIGAPAIAKILTPEARLTARAKRFAFSVERLRGRGTFSVQMTNRGKEILENPTVKLWLPTDVKDVALAGSYVLKRKASLIGVPEDGTVLVMLPSLRPGEQRTLKLKVTANN